ncbi:MAG TPA: sigma 54-interacting transcriptional regulator [Polyangiaceae bacterium]|nr:MAG: Regulatory protein LuxO [Deltaproteobacteria bacterium ADurb.Bin207]HNS97357.1 sigma 54-interacting transcriptional regulator [Polyangiaceae bacterium]HNZ21783.1 sigma 54-interacting transcriptional regulator [Polyangiaceae bacterium]HOD23493.1 sigma 54-interacting transcriptional regulator [Polyangiaceae bacterium]HOE51512.1 sigma 54-interacting transcriptional regulator [Polyangiaceae bacterium]
MRKVQPSTVTITRPRSDSMHVETATFRLTVVSGPNQGQGFELDGLAPSRVLAGTSPACEIRLSDPLISRRHCAIEQTGRRLRIADLGSTNGTFVNGVEIVEAWLDGGENLLVGGTTFHVQKDPTAKTALLPARTMFGSVVGASEEMRKLYPLCERLAASSVPVIIEGETGTGKEVLAESLHAEGPRANGPYVVFDCTATPPDLMESAIFGHEKGAFTGATDTRAGVFEQADGGTLLLDEIGDLHINLQPKLLRVIQSMEVQRVGGARRRKVDVRVLAATRRDLDREVQAGRFRDDLYYRLAVARIELPPLRRRRGDISLLAKYFWSENENALPIPTELLQRLEDYEWPGNVRELRNVVLRHQALGDLARFERPLIADSPDALMAFSDPVGEIIHRLLPLAEARQEVIQLFEQRYLEHILAVNDGNVTRAAAAAGVARRYFHLLRAKYAAKNTPHE